MTDKELQNYVQEIKESFPASLVKNNRFVKKFLSDDTYIEWFVNVWDHGDYLDLYELAVELGYKNGIDDFLRDLGYVNVYGIDPVYSADEFLTLLSQYL